MSRVSSVNVINIDYHRNGVGGEGFYAIVFESDIDGIIRRFVASVFIDDDTLETEDYFNPCCAVLEIDKLSDERSVKFGFNSWRGDDFFYRLRPAIQEYRKLFNLDDAKGEWPR